MATDYSLEVTLMYARNLKDVNLLSRMKTYAEVTLDSSTKFKYTSKTDTEGGVNPKWNETFGFTLSESMLRSVDSSINIRIFTLGTLDDSKLVGEVQVPLSEISKMSYNEPNYRNYPIKAPSGEYYGGTLHLTFVPIVPKRIHAAPPPTQPHDQPGLRQWPGYEHPSYPLPSASRSLFASTLGRILLTDLGTEIVASYSSH